LALRQHSVNAKVLAHGHHSRSRPFKSGHCGSRQRTVPFWGL
jgi:hypothetical protein